ncbi:MAG TPA: type II toxin-antitoxin system VapB family antitoxin [Nocardioides sp.]|nr:type II toxin-antitoxin system VapB family antitoxin [Nocardioides sp.]
MSLNIKNERVHALAREAARVTGKTQTSAIEEALEKLLADYGADPAATDRQRRMDIVREIALEWHDLTETEGADRIQGEADLYDPETGLPA